MSGNALTQTDAKNQTTTTSYDSLERPLQVGYHDGSQVLYTWDIGNNALGRLSKVTEKAADASVSSELQYSYDAQGRLAAEVRTVGGIGSTTQYAYTAGQLSSLQTPSGRQIAYQRNAAGQVVQVTLTSNGQSQILASNIEYQAFGGIKRYSDGAGQSHTWNYDQDGRVAAYSLGGQPWLLTYDNGGRIIGQFDGSNASSSAIYSYDALDRLLGVVLPNTNYGYTYDDTGNRSTQVQGSVTRNYSTATTSNRLVGLSNPSQTLAYDNNGSLTGDGSSQYDYDARGRLNQVTRAGVTTRYQVNAQGQRIRKSGNETTYYHYDPAGHLIAESNAAGTVLREYLWLENVPLAVLQ